MIYNARKVISESGDSNQKKINKNKKILIY